MFLSDLEAIFKQTPSFPLYGGIKWKTRSLSLKCFFQIWRRFLNRLRRFPLYGGIKWKTERSLSLKCFLSIWRRFLNRLRRFPLYAPIKWKRRSLFKNRLQIERNTLKDSAFSTLCPHLEKTSLFKNRLQIERNTLRTDSAFSTLCPHKVEKTESV